MSQATDSAHQLIGAYYQLEVKHSHRLLELDGELATIRATAGGAVLDAEMAGSIPADVSGDLARFAAQRETTLLAISEARERRAREVLELWKAEAAELLERAAAIEADAKAHEARSSELLKARGEHDGANYIPQCEVPIPVGVYASDVRFVMVPKGRLMRTEAYGMRVQAGELQRRTVSRTSTFEGEWGGADNVEAAIITAIQENLKRIGPLLVDVHQWALKQAGIIAEFERKQAGGNVRYRYSYSASWDGRELTGKIHREEIDEYVPRRAVA